MQFTHSAFQTLKTRVNRREVGRWKGLENEVGKKEQTRNVENEKDDHEERRRMTGTGQERETVCYRQTPQPREFTDLPAMELGRVCGPAQFVIRCLWSREKC